jgi:hypothetical protein
MKDLMGVGADERLPSPHDPQPEPADGTYAAGGQTRIYHRPDWKAGVKNEANKVVRPRPHLCFLTRPCRPCHTADESVLVKRLVLSSGLRVSPEPSSTTAGKRCGRLPPPRPRTASR